MVRGQKVLEKKLKKINAELINYNFPRFIGVKNAIANYWFLKGKSWSLAYALNKIDHDGRGNRYADRKKTLKKD